MLLLGGCSPPPEDTPPPAYEGPLFCDRYQVRRFSQAEVDTRVVHGPTNFRLDLLNNADWEADCSEDEIAAVLVPSEAQIAYT